MSTLFQQACARAAAYSLSDGGCTCYVNAVISVTYDKVQGYAVSGAEITGYTVSDWFGPETVVRYTNGKQYDR